MRQDVESFKDFLQYYRNHYVKGRTDGELYLVVGDVSENTVLMHKYVNGRAVADVHMHWKDVLNSIYFGLPRLGMMVYRHELLFLYYRTVRSGGRGYDPGKILVSSFNAWALMRAGLPAQAASSISEPHFVHIATRHNHTPWGEAMTDLFSTTPKTPAYALSYNFGAYIDDNHQYPVLCYKTDLIGDIVAPTAVKLAPEYQGHRTLLQRWLNSELEFVT